MKTKKKGGIQKGTTASSKESIAHDNQLGICSQWICERDWFPNLIWRPKGKCGKLLPKKVSDYSGFEPDGGVWCHRDDPDTPVYVSESKYGGLGGQADADFIPKYVIIWKTGLKAESPYTVFGTGPAAKSNQGAKTKKDRGKFYNMEKLVNNMLGKGNLKFHLDEQGFTVKEMIDILYNDLCKISKPRPNIKFVYPEIENPIEKQEKAVLPI